MSRTIASYVFCDGLGLILLKALSNSLNKSNSGYTLMLDETTMAQVVKQMDILVHDWCENELDEANLSTEKLINFSSDGPNINKSLWRLLDEALKEKGSNGLLPLITCTLHVIHNGFHRGLNVNGHEAQELAFDIYYWFRIA